MKKLLTLLLVLLMVVAGCQKADEPKEDDKTKETGTKEPEKKPEEQKPEATDAVINVYTRDATSGTREAFEDGVGLLKDKKSLVTKDAVEVDGNGSMATKVGEDKNGIGYVSLTTDFEANNLKPVKYEGVEPTVETVLDESYTLSRPFAYTTRAKGDFESDKKEQVIAAFLDFLHNSTEGLEAVEGAGGIVDLSKAKPWAELKEAHAVLKEDVSDITILTVGSTSVEKTIKAALEAFQADTKVQFKMTQTGSGDGWKRTLGGEKDSANKGDIGFASRNFKAEEDTSKAMTTDKYCLDAVVVVVNKENTSVENLTADQIFKIFSGETKNFADIK